MIQDLHLYPEVEEQYMTAGIYDSGTRKSKKGPETEKGETGCCLELNGGPGACVNLEVIA